MILDNEAVKAGVGVSLPVAKGPRIDRLDTAAGIIRRRRQREKMDDADQHPVRPAEYALERVLSRSRDRGADFRHC